MAFSVSYNIRAIDEFSKTLNNIKKNFSNFNNKLSSEFKTSSNSSKKFCENINSIKDKTAKVSSNLKGMSNNIRTNNLSSFNRVVNNIGNSVANVGGKIKNAFQGGIKGSGLIKGLAVGGIVGASAARESSLAQEKLRLSVLVTNSNELTRSMSQMRTLAIETNKPMNELTESFRLLLEQGNSASQAFSQLKKQIDISAYTGISSEEITRLFTKVNQSGKVTNEILDSLNDKGLQLKGILAKMEGMKFNTPYDKQAFDNLVSSGAITTKQLDKALKLWFKSHKAATNISESLAQTGTLAPIIKLKNAFLDLTTSIFQSFASTIHLNSGLNILANGVEKVSNYFRNLNIHHNIVAGGTSILAAFIAIRTSLISTKAMFKGFISLITGKGLLNSIKVFGSELLGIFTPLLKLKNMFGWIGSKITGTTLGAASLFLQPNTLGTGDTFTKRQFDFWHKLPKRPTGNTFFTPNSKNFLYTSLGFNKPNMQSNINSINNNSTNNNLLYNMSGFKNQEMTSNINLNIESTNAIVKSIISEHKGNNSNMNLGVNAYRR